MNIHRLLPALLLGSLLAPAAPAAVEYEVVNLGTLGGTRSVALGLNDRSEAVGWSIDGHSHTQAFRWRHGVMTGLGFLSNISNSVAKAINNSGEIVGSSAFDSIYNRDRMYRLNPLQHLRTLGG